MFPAFFAALHCSTLFIWEPSWHMTGIRALAPVMGVYDMNRSVIIGAIVVLLAAGGYYQFSYKPAQEAATAAAEAAAKAEADAKAAEEAAAAKAAEDAAAAQAAADQAAAAATDAATATTEAATDATAAATDAAAALDPANFNADAVVALIDGSTLDDATKATLKTAVEAAKANPALVADTVAQVKTALGM
jgi:type II secretory pathway component PulM